MTPTHTINETTCKVRKTKKTPCGEPVKTTHPFWLACNQVHGSSHVCRLWIHDGPHECDCGEWWE